MSTHLDEAARQRILDLYRVVDSLPEAAYNDIVTLASTLCDAPIAVVSLVDRDRQWFKASHGLDGTGTPRDEAFCSHAIEAPGDLMEIADAREDARFESNPIVTGDMSIRFYAGMPLVTEGGAAIGTVCVLDQKPRQLNATQRAGLQSLARLTMTLLDARLHGQELERQVMLTEAVHGDVALAAPPAGYTVGIFQIQDLAGHALRRGERTLERQLQELEQSMNQLLQAGRGDSVNRTAQSSDFIAVLHGDNTSAIEMALFGCVADFTARTGIHIFTSSAASTSPDERIEMVFLRADDELTRVKDAAVEHSTQHAA